MVLSGSVQPGDKIVVAVEGDHLDFDVETGGAAELIPSDEEKEPAAASL